VRLEERLSKDWRVFERWRAWIKGCLLGVIHKQRRMLEIETYRLRNSSERDNSLQIPRPAGRGYFTTTYKLRRGNSIQIPRPAGRGYFTTT
jgi:hypothetical protein